MNITFTENPLAIMTKLNDEELERLLNAVKLEQFENLTYFNKDDSTLREKMQAITRLDIDSDEVLAYASYLTEEHCGDCTCVPASCVKCHAEYLLDYSTFDLPSLHDAFKNMPFIDKSIASSIQSTFYDYKNKKFRSVEEALAELTTMYTEEPNEHYVNHKDVWLANYQRFNETKKQAAEYLKEYTCRRKLLPPTITK